MNKPAPKRTIGNLPDMLPRIEEIIEPDSLNCPWGCGIMHKIGEDRSERPDIVPAQLRIIVSVRPKSACRACTDGVVQASARSHLIMGGLPTEATIAHFTVSKYGDYLPLYRQSPILVRAGLDLHRAVLADWVGRAAFDLKLVIYPLPNTWNDPANCSWMEPPPQCWIRVVGRQRPGISGHWPVRIDRGSVRTRWA